MNVAAATLQSTIEAPPNGAAANGSTEPTEAQQPSKNEHDENAATASKAAPQVPEFLFVLDTTALPGKKPRKHELIIDGLIKSFEFQPGQPLRLETPIAIKFLRHPEFKRSNEKGDLMPYARRPRQPEELGAGERFALKDHQTVADYNELTNMALYQRAMELPGGEMLGNKRDRQALIDFITKTTVDKRKANAAKQSDVGRDEFTPAPESDAVI
jgi:hypothetical protein